MLPPETRDAVLEHVLSIPIFSTLDMRPVDLDLGACTMHVPRTRPYTGSYLESFHGGIQMAVADSTAYCAILTRTGPDAPMTTTDMNIRFLAPCLTDLRAEARVIKCGRTLCPVAVELFDANDKAVAVAQVTYLRLEKTPSP